MYCNGECDCNECYDEYNCDDGEGKETFYCDDGDDVSASWVCDDYCDCTGCEDEVSCPDGLGVTRIDLGGISVNLNLKHDGGKYGVMTVDVIEDVIDCLLHGDCPW